MTKCSNCGVEFQSTDSSEAVLCPTCAVAMVDIASRVGFKFKMHGVGTVTPPKTPTKEERSSG